MKLKSFFSMAIVAIAVSTTLISCGGETGTSVSKNKVLGEVPALKVAFKTEKAAFKEKLKKATSMDEAMKIDVKQDEMKAEYTKKIDEAVRKLTGTNMLFEVPANAFYEVVSATFVEQPDYKNVCSSPYVNIVLKNKEEIKLVYASDNDENYTIYYKMVNENGDVLDKGQNFAFRPNLVGKEKNMTIAPNTEMSDQPLYIECNDAKWANFEKIVFISKEEYDQTQIVK